ncbi:MAG: DegT/DnrJ/EryC1/StrS family aminotransferase [Anaerolineae bacterium]
MMLLTAEGIRPTPTQFQDAERTLLHQIEGTTAFWSGRAATSLYQAYQLARHRRPDVSQPQVIVPAMMCATAANTALLADVQPRFADVNAQTGLATLSTIQARYTPQTIAVVVIHLLGHAVDIAPIAEWCKAYDLLLIEDGTQALGGRDLQGYAIGTQGDVTVYSFNRTKIISTGNGVLVAHDDDTAQDLTALAKHITFPAVTDDMRLQLALSYRNLHHALVGLLRARAVPTEQVTQAFMAVRPAYQALYLRPADTTVDLNRPWENLPASLAHRLEMARLYAERLADHPAWDLLTDYEQSGVCWRFSLLLNDPQQQVSFSEAVRADGFHVSNLYWAVNPFFKADDECQNADLFSRRIVNLWVDESVSTEYVARCCDSILRHAPSD